MADTIEVEVAYAEPHRQFLRRVVVPACATVADAIAASGVATDFSIDVGGFAMGIWSKPVARDAALHDGDRIELYRPLTADPKEIRRRRVKR